MMITVISEPHDKRHAGPITIVTGINDVKREIHHADDVKRELLIYHSRLFTHEKL